MPRSKAASPTTIKRRSARVAVWRLRRWRAPACCHGMAIFSRGQYLQAARSGFAHLQAHNLEYLDDGAENIIDDFCALLAATELLAVTGEGEYADAAIRRALSLLERQSAQGWFRADALGERSWFHAVDAGLPLIALQRYAEVVPTSPAAGRIRAALRDAYEFEISITFNEVNNPFGYPRQYVKQPGSVGQTQFFIPHDNGTGYWWQGENARLGSLAAAATRAQRLFEGEDDMVAALERYAQGALDWILGANPYDAACCKAGGAITRVTSLVITMRRAAFVMALRRVLITSTTSTSKKSLKSPPWRIVGAGASNGCHTAHGCLMPCASAFRSRNK